MYAANNNIIMIVIISNRSSVAPYLLGAGASYRCALIIKFTK